LKDPNPLHSPTAAPEGKIRVIFFDAAGTLIHLPRGVAWHYREIGRRHGKNIPEAALARAFRAAWTAMPTPPETRAPRPDDDKGWWRELVGRVLDECHVKGGGFNRDKYFEDLYVEFIEPEVWELYPEVRRVLARLRRRFELGILSNFDGRLRLILEDLRIARFFKHWVISSEAGADKPSPWLFEHAAAKAGVTVNEALHVGDDPECDWAGAEAAGLRVFRLERPGVTLEGVEGAAGGSGQ
jgi:putative hydrolase of the HAD superfamily